MGRTTGALAWAFTLLALASAWPSPAQQTLVAPAYLEAATMEKKGDFDGAMAKVSEALRQDPGNLKAYILRGDLYAKKRSWPQAGQDFQAALKIDPANAFAQFDLAEIKLMQKQFALARPGFSELVDDPQLGDLAAYKTFLCDLFAGHKDDAARQLQAFDRAPDKPSYSYANAAWTLYNKRPDDARSWLDSAARIYSAEINHNYLSTLNELGYLPLPPE